MQKSELESLYMRSEGGLAHFRQSGEIASLEEQARFKTLSSKNISKIK